MFDPTKNKKSSRRTAITWATEALPSVIRSAIAKDPSHCGVSAREVACTDPDCAPIDTCFFFVFSNGRKAVAAVPGTFEDLRRDAVYDAVLRKRAWLVAAHEGRDAPRGRRPARGGSSSSFGSRPDDAWWYASFGIVTALVARRAGDWRRAEDVVAAAAAAAGGSLALYAGGLVVASTLRGLVATARRRVAGPGASSSGRATVAGKRAKFTDLGHKRLRGCPCCDPDLGGALGGADGLFS